MTRTGNHVFYALMVVVALLATMPPDISALLGSLVPAKWKPYVAAMPLLAMWIRSHLNLISEPPK